jgi:hypothetical protein
MKNLITSEQVDSLHGSTNSPRTESTQTVRSEFAPQALPWATKGLNQKFLAAL